MLKKIANFPIEKIILFNVFIRNFAVSFATIYISTLFMIEVGSDKWPMILMYVQFFSLTFIFMTNFMRSRHYYLFHKIVILLTVTSLGLFLMNPHNKALIIAVAVMCFAVDLIGEITATSIISRSMSALAYKATSPRFVTYATSAHILASLTVIAVQKLGNTYLFVGVISFFLFMHFILFSLMSAKALKTPSKVNFLSGESFVDRIQETAKYSLNNALIPLIFGLFIWAQVTKFLSDWIYLSSSSLLFTSKDDLSVFLSVANIGLMLLMFTFQKTVGKRVLGAFTPSTLIGVIPFLLLILSIMGIMTRRPEVGIAINLFFIFISKSIHNPILQISLHSIDQKYKARVILLLNFCISICLLVVTTGMRSMRSHFSLDMIYISLLLMGILGLILMLRFEGPYFKNLWQNLSGDEDELNRFSQIVDPNTIKEEEVRADFFNPHHYFTEHYSRKISSAVADYLQILYDYPRDDTSPEFIEYFYSGKRTPFEKLLLIMNVYVFSKNQQLFKVAVKAHKHILNDSGPADKEKGQQILALMEVPECRLQEDNEEAQLFQRKMSMISENIDEVMPETSAVHLRLKIFALINWDFLTAGNQIKFQEIMKSPYSEGLRSLSQLLSSPKIRTVKHELLRSWIPAEARIDTNELLRRYLDSSQDKRRSIQKIFMTYLPTEEEAQTGGKMVFKYSQEKKDQLSSGEILDLLFVREWTGLKSLHMAYVLDSVHDYEELTDEERKYWKDFHLEYLKKAHSDWFAGLVRDRL